MSVAHVFSRAQVGLHAPLVHVEVNLGAGLPMFNIVGLPTKAVKESKERVRAALINSQFEFPPGRITVNLSPADLPKEGGRFDLPIALGILRASGQLVSESWEDEFYGELSLSGELKPVRGVFLAAAHAAQAGHGIIVPIANADEAATAARSGVKAASHLLEVCAHVQKKELLASRVAPATATSNASEPDISEVRGQSQAKRALLIAASGAHSLLMLGPPGSGKSMLAKRLPGLLPPLSEAEAIEAATIASVGVDGFNTRNFRRPPFRAPHHTASAHSLVGGGPWAQPGEVSLAHHGVLFLDELPEFDRRVLESLREPLETGTISVARARVHADYPARVLLVCAMNPCPCGYYGDPMRCKCTPDMVRRYRGRISGPLLDRIDLRIEVAPVQDSELMGRGPQAASLSTAEAVPLVQAARARQLQRARKLNAHMDVHEVEKHCVLTSDGERLLAQSVARLGFSARSYHRTLRVARTIADLEASEPIELEHVAEAIQLKRALEETSGLRGCDFEGGVNVPRPS